MTKHEEFGIKLDRVAGFLRLNALKAIVLSRGDNFAWLGCGANNLVNDAQETGVASLVVTARGVTLVTNNIEAERLLAEELRGLPLAGVEVFPWHKLAERTRILGRLCEPGCCAADDGTPGMSSLPPEFNRLRWRLTPAEVKRYSALGRDCAAAVEDAALALESGMSEHEAAALLALECRMRAITPVVLLVAGERRVRRWRHPLPKAVSIGRYVMLVLCGRRHGLVAAITRIVHFGPVPPELARRHRAACAVDAAMILTTRPGARVADVLARAKRAYADAGFPDEWQFHHQGGAIGYRPREYIATDASEEVVEPPQAFAWNPSVRGTKSEDTVLVTEAGTRVLTACSKAWPTLRVEVDGGSLERPDILVR